MTDTEFSQWNAYHATLFPTIGDKLKQNIDTQKAWRILLREISLEDAKAVSDDMAAGRLDHPAAYEWDRLPGIIRSEVGARKHHESRKPEPGYKGAWNHVTEKDASMSAAYREYVRLKAKGFDENDCACASRTLLGTATEQEQERYEAIK